MQIWADTGEIGSAHLKLFTNLISVFNVYTKLETVSPKLIEKYLQMKKIYNWNNGDCHA